MIRCCAVRSCASCNHRSTAFCEIPTGSSAPSREKSANKGTRRGTRSTHMTPSSLQTNYFDDVYSVTTPARAREALDVVISSIDSRAGVAANFWQNVGVQPCWRTCSTWHCRARGRRMAWRCTRGRTAGSLPWAPRSGTHNRWPPTPTCVCSRKHGYCRTLPAARGRDDAVGRCLLALLGEEDDADRECGCCRLAWEGSACSAPRIPPLGQRLERKQPIVTTKSPCSLSIAATNEALTPHGHPNRMQHADAREVRGVQLDRNLGFLRLCKDFAGNSHQRKAPKHTTKHCEDQQEYMPSAD